MVLDEGASNGSVDVSLVVPKGGDEVRALKLSLTVKGEGGEALEAGFGFSKAVEGAAVTVSIREPSRCRLRAIPLRKCP